jgi:glycosyltransferase involved in cell wall biosynthesis
MSDQSISVIINSCEADEHYLGRCFSAIHWQLTAADELILVCDTDRSEFDRWKPPCEASYVRHSVQSWKGISKARNAGAALAKSRWLKFMDVDDVLAPFALSSFRKLDCPETVKVIAGGQTTIHNGAFSMDFIPANPARFMEQERINIVNPWGGINTQNPALVSHTFIERAAFNEVGGFDEKVDWEEEWDLWIRLWQKYGLKALAMMRARVCYYWISDEERTKKIRRHEVNGMDVHQYLHEKYGINPGYKF